MRLRWEFPSEELAAHTSVSIVNTSLFGFVLYDDATRYEINFPKPQLLQGTATDVDLVEEDTDNVAIAPDHKGKPWEKYAGCSEAARLVPLCKKANIGPHDASHARDGWFQVPLPTMLMPPKGYFRDPDAEACDTRVPMAEFLPTESLGILKLNFRKSQHFIAFGAMQEQRPIG